MSRKDRSRPRPAAAAAEPRPPIAPGELPARLVFLAPVVAGLIAHGGALGGFFAADDIDFLMRARGLDSWPWGWARPLPGVLRWKLLTAAFGVQPLPHMLLALALHLACALLVARIVLRSGLGGVAAIVASVIVAGSSIAYSSTHWASGLGEVMAAALALAAVAIHVECRLEHRPALAWAAAACALGAVASKESALLLPFAVAAYERFVPLHGPGRGALRPIAWFGGAAALAVVIAWRIAPQVSGEAYALTGSPMAWLVNLGTYLAWLVRIFDPLRDRNAVPDPGLLPWGALVLAAWGFAAWSERLHPRRPMTAGLAWFALLLAPIVPLTVHSYLSYLVAPLAGFALAVGALASPIVLRAGRSGAITLAIVLAGYVGNEAYQIHERRTRAVGEIVVDRVARESALLQRSLSDLRRSHVVAGDTLVLVSPYPMRSVDATQGVVHPAGQGFGPHAYVPLGAALRGGPALPLFLPGVTVLGMGDGVPPEWERARVFRFENDGRLADLGRAPAALDSLASDYLAYERWSDARGALERLLELGQDGPELRWRLGSALAHLGDDAGGYEQANLILERWPDSPRARALRENASRAGQVTPPVP